MKTKEIQKSIKCDRVGNCSIKIVLDKRTNKDTDTFPVCVCFTINRQRYYHRLLDIPAQTEKHFNEVCSVTNSRSTMMEEFKSWQRLLDEFRAKIIKLSQTQILSIDSIRTYFSGSNSDTGNCGTASFIGTWEQIIADYNRQGRVGTAENYTWALNSFKKSIGNIEGFRIDKNTIARWNEIMKSGRNQDGTIIGKIADATRGMYLRTCRVVWNECIRQGYLSEDSYPFSNKDKSMISIPKGKKRQQSYLNVNEMTALFRVFENKRYPESWDPEYTKRAHESLGLFLVQYLCNGFNLADAGRLTYNNTYYAEGGRAFEFMRKKTSARSNNMSVVVVPIISPLKKILDEIAAKPEKDALVFPQIFRGAIDELTRRKLTVQENSNIKDRVNRICSEVLGWNRIISCTWARHSFATNLKIAGIEELYISESMGHSNNNDVTCGYQDNYPLDIRFRNNSKLLNIEDDTQLASDMHYNIDLDSMSENDMRILLKSLFDKTYKN